MLVGFGLSEILISCGFVWGCFWGGLVLLVGCSDWLVRSVACVVHFWFSILVGRGVFG